MLILKIELSEASLNTFHLINYRIFADNRKFCLGVFKQGQLNPCSFRGMDPCVLVRLVWTVNEILIYFRINSNYFVMNLYVEFC